MVTAASLFDGHDAAINIIRRMLQRAGVEVIHLGHNRAAQDVVRAAVQENVQAIGISSYQGGHMSYFRYVVDLLRDAGAERIKIFGGGGGTITEKEKEELHHYGVTRIFTAIDGQRIGLQGMIDQIVKANDHPPEVLVPTFPLETALTDDSLGRWLSHIEETYPKQVEIPVHKSSTVIVGVTGTGGAGKSSLTDELLLRLVTTFPKLNVGVVCIDPTKSSSGGALLGDRIRMNVLEQHGIFFRSMATRQSHHSICASLPGVISAFQVLDYDLLLVETSGIGQGDSQIGDFVDISLYGMTPEFGAQTQLEKIDMLDVADLVVINKADTRGSLDALNDVRKAYQRAHALFDTPLEQMPVYLTTANRFKDAGVDALFTALMRLLHQRAPAVFDLPSETAAVVPKYTSILPPDRAHYLSTITETIKHYHRGSHERARDLQQLWANSILQDPELVIDSDYLENLKGELGTDSVLDHDTYEALSQYVNCLTQANLPESNFEVRGKTIRVENFRETLSGLKLPKLGKPSFTSLGDIYRWVREENFPGYFPFTAGVFPFRREGEAPTRMFAGEGSPERTNQRFHYLSRDSNVKRLSTAFDSVTLYGENPHERLDIWGKIGNSGVSVAHVEDMELLYSGFDLCDPKTSVSMTINGPAPTILAFFFNTAIRQQLRLELRRQGKINLSEGDCFVPGSGGYHFDDLRRLISDDAYHRLVDDTVDTLRGTVQADILKEDQAQNTCIFSVNFSLRLMADVAKWFVDHGVKNFYSVSVSGYHIAEAGANPITQLAFTLANGFTYVEFFLSRGLSIDQIVPQLSFFFSNGMDAEYAVIGRVARRIWAIALRERYGANIRSQKLKYHIQTSGRSLHAQEIAFNDIRTTLQALLAYYDNCNSLHTNAYDEAVTTPTEASVRRAIAIQRIIQEEFGVAQLENVPQGSFVIEELTSLVEAAVLEEFQRLCDRGGVLGAMERMYQRTRIQEESLLYERMKHSGRLPIIGVNTFIDETSDTDHVQIELIRATEAEKAGQLQRLAKFHEHYAPRRGEALERIHRDGKNDENLFQTLMDVSNVLSLGQITQALYQLGGQYRRNM